jgi:hypothetical protein
MITRRSPPRRGTVHKRDRPERDRELERNGRSAKVPRVGGIEEGPRVRPTLPTLGFMTRPDLSKS